MMHRQFALLAALALIAGCSSDGVSRPDPTTIRVFNAAANLQEIRFLREATVTAELPYGTGSQASFDSGPYDFNIDYPQIGESAPVRGLTFNRTLAPDLEYTFVAVAPGGALRVIEASNEKRSDATLVRWTLVHAHPGFGSLDLYVEPPGSMLANAVSRGTIAFEQSLTFEFSAGTYRLWLTTAGDPGDIIFESLDLNPPEASDDALVVSDPGGFGLADIAVSPISQSGALVAEGQVAALRVVNAVDDRLDRDVYLDATTDPVLFSALPFGVVSDYREVELGTHSVIVTPVGNPGAEEATGVVGASPGRLYTTVIAGNSTEGIHQLIAIEDKRAIEEQATLRLFNAAENFAALSVYLVPPGTDLTTVPPTIQLAAPDLTGRVPLVPGDVEIYIDDAVNMTRLGGPFAVTLGAGGYYGLLLVNGADGNTVEIVQFDDFAP